MELFFYIFASLVILGSVGVVASRSAVHSVLWLIFAFCNCAGLFVLLGAEFLAMTLVIVYVGAVAVLFLFVVMMLGGSLVDIKKDLKNNLPIGLLLLGIFVFDLILVALAGISSHETRAQSLIPILSEISNTHAIGNILYTDFMLPFQVAGLILFVAMIGSIVLTLRVRTGVRRQVASDQLSRDKESGMEIVRIESGKGVEGIKY
jgi:NADH-quinone oxidoreductase subunit J